jgi:ABC-type transporter Mla maintaining outer membrane lipid asymmetry ATPase subunit MlaF
MTVAVAIAGLKVRRGGRDVLRIPALEIAAGQVTGLMGPSGDGIASSESSASRAVKSTSSASRPARRRCVRASAT